MIISSVEIGLHCIRLLAFHRFRFFGGLTAGEVVGERLGPPAAVPAGLAIGNAKFGDGDTPNVADIVDDGDNVAPGEEKGLGEGLGGGGGGMIFSQ